MITIERQMCGETIWKSSSMSLVESIVAKNIRLYRHLHLSLCLLRVLSESAMVKDNSP